MDEMEIHAYSKRCKVSSDTIDISALITQWASDSNRRLMDTKGEGYKGEGSHGNSLPSNASLMVGKRVLQGEAWSDLGDSRGTHDLGDKLGDKFGDLGDK
ncbi:hypothetical protein AVEN_24753-1 [Araneus ventricosus]|uniref:Uncharacterized protein n=1 Tax=Araneus ventricosus TaxID=182803 RepID=A0A4Y2SS25_ARAVE|nr:hypothetical protein AVEN_24753-1 [Araneus ventricosus]